MAEKNEAKAERPKPETNRIVLGGIELPIKSVAKALAEQFDYMGGDAQKVENKLASEGDGKVVTLWVELGKGKGGQKKKAIESCVGEDQPGRFRAPGESAWRGGILKRKPERIVLDTLDLD